MPASAQVRPQPNDFHWNKSWRRFARKDRSECRECDPACRRLIDADGNHGVTGRINKPPDARTLLYPKVLSLTVQSGDKAKEHGQRPEMSKPNSHGARSSDWGAEVKPSYPAHHKSFQSGRWHREACEPGRPSVRTR